ncbi:hypothetical protein NRIC_09000 [Enterococcus florum]|uniref:CAAX prenyl protease 2/Lysostaphin resistance protein A-like domain-containing protein n=1 Tax=Enterococcus florum TaxID=2480627 RepID=A0A4V0WP88_9ENTE|nr:hypothetical protein NRIC_09000 [Enterococcus florum]
MFYFREPVSAIGLKREQLAQSFCIGAIGGLILLLGVSFYEASHLQKVNPVLGSIGVHSLVLFIIGVVSEEVSFRGYIEPRVSAAFHSEGAGIVITGLMFVLSHYPVKWAVSGFSLWTLEGSYVVVLFLLHLFCSAVYRKTGCLYGAILLHLLYNVGSAVLIL